MLSRDEYVKGLVKQFENLEAISKADKDVRERDESMKNDVLSYLYENLRKQHASLLSLNEELEAMYSNAKEEVEQQNLLIFSLNEELKDTRRQYLNSTMKLTQRLVTCESARAWAANSFSTTTEHLNEVQEKLDDQRGAIEQLLMLNVQISQRLDQLCFRNSSSLDFLKKTFERDPLQQNLDLNSFDSEALRSLVGKAIHQRSIDRKAILFYVKQQENNCKNLFTDVNQKLISQLQSHGHLEDRESPMDGQVPAEHPSELQHEPGQSLLGTLLDSFSRFFKDDRVHERETRIPDTSDPTPVPALQGPSEEFLRDGHVSVALAEGNKLSKIDEEDDEGTEISDKLSASEKISYEDPGDEREATLVREMIIPSSKSQRSWMIML